MNIWFTSDHHFGHSNIIRFCNRPFNDVHEMDDALIQVWNKWVKPNDQVWHLGDFGFTGAVHERVLPRLTGKKELIFGNHDPVRKFTDYQRSLWNSASECRLFKADGIQIFLQHRPQRAWEGSYRETMHLFGHVHGKLEGNPWGKSMDVGVDPTAWREGEYRPLNLDEIVSALKSRPSLDC